MDNVEQLDKHPLEKKQDEPSKVRKIVKFLNGKKVIKRTCGPGYRYDPKGKRCVRLSPQELRKMKLASKKRVRLMKKKMASILLRRKKSLKIRKSRMGDN